MDVSGSRGAPPIAQDTHPVASRAIRYQASSVYLRRHNPHLRKVAVSGRPYGRENLKSFINSIIGSDAYRSQCLNRRARHRVGCREAVSYQCEPFLTSIETYAS